MKSSLIDPNRFGKVAVLYGGESSEREVSLRSGKAVSSALNKLGIQNILIDTKYGFNNLMNVDRVFIALHGVGGEDGCVQGLLESLKIPYTGSNVLSSALAMNKNLTKIIWEKAKLPTAVFGIAANQEDASILANKIGYPVVLKPTLEGSSIGVNKASNQQELYEYFGIANQIGEVLIEKFIDGKEITVAILNKNALEPIEIKPTNEFYDFESKYTKGGANYHIPSSLSKEEVIQVQNLALQAAFILNVSGLSRVDFIQDQKKNFYLLEINTSPGMTEISLVPHAARYEGIKFEHLVFQILEMTLNK